MVYKHAYLYTLLLLHSAFMFCMVKMLLKAEVGGRSLNSNGNYIDDHGNHGKSWKNLGIVFLNFCGNPVAMLIPLCDPRLFTSLSSIDVSVRLSDAKPWCSDSE